MAHHAVAHPAGVFLVALVLLHFLPMSRDCRVIGILLSPRRYPTADQSECDGRQHENVFVMGISLLPQSASVSCFGLTGPLTYRTRHFIPCWRAL